ncbi:heterokaryon incompatibility, partial [Bisporella sp. PMI_857]
PPYHALSYTWGSWEDSEDIYLEGCMYKVTKNLAAVLRRLAQDTSGPQNFWIDAICINQDDPYERNHQVKKMRAIYEQADCVKIWLGEEEQRSDLAFTLAHQLVDYNARGEDTSLLINDPRIARHFRAFQLLLWRPYWRRVWVIQEVYSAKQAEV